MKLVYIFISIIFSIFFIYSILPSIWYRTISSYTIRSLKSNKVALTFDDGPDKKNTPKVLDELSRLNLKVTFFVLGSKSIENPNIIKRAIDEGHEIELHGMNHKCHWFLSPLATYRDIKLSVYIAKDEGIEPKFYRPPWGLYNIFTVPICRKYNLKCVHWSLHGFDWSKRSKPKGIVKRIVKKVKNGDIVLLHDSGGAPGAPERSLAAIEGISQGIKNAGLSIVQLDMETSTNV